MTDSMSSKRLTIFRVRVYIGAMLEIFKYDSGSYLSSFSLTSKSVLALAATCGVMFCDKPEEIIAVAAVGAVVLILTGVKLANLATYFLKLSPLILIVFLFNLFYYGGDLLFEIAGLRAGVEGARAGLLSGLRLVAFMLIAVLFFRHVSAVEVGRCLVGLSRVLRIRQLEELAIAFFVAVRFMPLLAEEIANVKTAIQLRGGRFSGRLIPRIGFNLKIIVPLFAQLIRQAYDVGTALTIKSFRNRYFPAAPLRLRGKDLIVLPLAIGLALILIR